MRKDVKLGLAVGGVLLAVLVVYVLVVPGSNSNQAGAILENLDGSEAQTGGAEGGDSVAQGETTAAGDSTGASAPDQQAKTGGATADAGGASGASGAVADAGGASAGDTSAGANGAAGGANTGATAKDNATAGGGWNWDALVNGTEKLPSMGAATDVSTNSTSNTSFANGGGGQPASGAAGNAGNLSTNTPSGTSTARGTAGQTGTAGGSVAQGGTAPQGGGADVLSNGTGGGTADGTAGGAGQSPSRQTTLAESTTPRTQDGAPARMTIASDSATRTHVVKVGDTYSKISLAVYGTSKHYADIELANPGVDPTRLKPGTTINLPAVAAKQPTATPAANGAAATIDPQKEYKVQPNDSLYTISLRLYGKADRMEKIYELNKSAIGDDRARLKLGMVLKLPEPPTQTTAAAQAR